MSAAVLQVIDVIALCYLAVVNGLQTVLITAAAHGVRLHRRVGGAARLTQLLSSPASPRISVIAPAFNEAATVAASVRALLTLRYPNLEVVLVNDGSSDDTLGVLQREFELAAVHPIFRRRIGCAPVRGVYRSVRHPSLVVVDKVNGGKADSLNAGLNFATGELVCAMDADTLIEPDAFLRIVGPFIDDDAVAAVGATIRVVNGCAVDQGRVVAVRAPTTALALIQTVEYLRAFLFGRLGWNRLGGNLIVSGAFGMFHRETLIAGGGYRTDTVGEDMELVVRLRRAAGSPQARHRVHFVPDPIAWTEVPESFKVLGRQRDRWQRGLADVLWRHRGLFFNPRYSLLGAFVFPAFVAVELLAPVVEALGIAALALALLVGAFNGSFALLFLGLAFGWAVVLNTWAVLLHQLSASRPFPARDLPRLLLAAVAEQVGYRQLTVIWRLRGMWRYARGNREWGTMVRRGFG